MSSASQPEQHLEETVTGVSAVNAPAFSSAASSQRPGVSTPAEVQHPERSLPQEEDSRPSASGIALDNEADPGIGQSSSPHKGSGPVQRQGSFSNQRTDAARKGARRLGSEAKRKGPLGAVHAKASANGGLPAERPEAADSGTPRSKRPSALSPRAARRLAARQELPAASPTASPCKEPSTHELRPRCALVPSSILLHCSVGPDGLIARAAWTAACQRQTVRV
jgi:hypothetical protein